MIRVIRAELLKLRTTRTDHLSAGRMPSATSRCSALRR
jgi:hypothetical protein